MADYRLLIAQGKQIVFEDERDFKTLWHDITQQEFLEFEGELVDGDDRFMGRVGLQRQHVIGLFLERSRSHGGH